MEKPPAIPLRLKRLDWGDGTPPDDSDWSVWYGDKTVGRIFDNSVPGTRTEWMWTITVTVPGYTLVPSHGLSGTRDEAMKAFRKRWDDASMGDRLRRSGDRG